MMKPRIGRICIAVEAAALVTLAAGCRSAYYRTMEAFGQHKRDILVSRVGDARDAQTEAREQFQTAFEKFSAVVKVPAGELESKYNQLRNELERSEARAKAVSSRIHDVETVAKDLFAEWQKELDEYTNRELRRSSEQRLKETQARYDQLISAMKQAERKIEPVLAAFRDQVLFLKHNLNAQAVASLQGELASIQSNVASLIKDMDASIAEANTFISSMSKP